MDVDCEPPEHHRAFCLRLEKHLAGDERAGRKHKPEPPASVATKGETDAP
jgi:hypothetical protein